MSINNINDKSDLTNLSDIAAEMKCAKSTLKSWAKSKTIPEIKDSSGAYLASMSTVAEILKSKPEVESIFHPKTASSAAHEHSNAENISVDSDRSSSSDQCGVESNRQTPSPTPSPEATSKNTGRNVSPTKKKKSVLKQKNLLEFLLGHISRLPAGDAVLLRNRLNKQLESY